MTRYASDDPPLSQERYMASAEFAELRGVSGTAVAARAAILDDPEMRGLIWWLQAKSLETGQLKRFARDLLAQYQDRLGTPSMHKLGIKRGKIFKGEALRQIHDELRGCVFDYADLAESGRPDPYDEKSGDRQTTDELLEKCRRLAVSDYGDRDSLEKFLYDVCINPRRPLLANAEGDELKRYTARVRESFDEISGDGVRDAGVAYFKDVVGALIEYQRRQADEIRKNFVLTAIGKKVWETLDFALKTGHMVVVEGWEGRGKTEAAVAWVRIHQGQAIFVSLKGVTNKTTFFRAIAKALGIASSYHRKSAEMQAHVEDVLVRSKLMLVIDEFHFAFPFGPRISSRPEIIDWIDTALCNQGVAVGCVTTPQIITCVRRAEAQAGWNWRQFRRRVARWAVLPEWTAKSDLEAIAQKQMPGLSRAGIKLAVGYAQVSLQGVPSRDVSGLGDVATEARLLAENAGRDVVTFDDVKRATDDLLSSDTAFASRMVPAAKRKRAGQRPADQPFQEQPIQEPAPPILTAGRREIAPRGEGATNRIADVVEH